MNAVGHVGALAVLVLASPLIARADHTHHDHAAATRTSAFGASVAVIAAEYETPSFVGDYQGVVAGSHWSDRRFAVSATLPLYRLRKNGALYHGLGDLLVHGQAALIRGHARRAGIAVAVSAPTGSQRTGLGMGHVMLMPGVWASVELGAVTLAATAGYGRALGAESHEGHPAGPLVDPMNVTELTWGTSADLALARELRVGATLGGGLALDEAGIHRVIGGVRVMWSAGRVDTTAEVQGGLAGDPFGLRGVVRTALRF